MSTVKTTAKKVVVRKPRVAKVKKEEVLEPVKIQEEVKALPHIDISPMQKFTYNQISNHSFNFALLTPDLKVMHTPFECKDYIQDILWAEYNQRCAEVYGLNWKSGSLDINQPRFYLGIFGGDNIMNVRVPYLAEFLHTFEDALGFERCKVMETDVPNQLVIEFDHAWTTAGPMISAFTTMIRVSGAYTGGDVMTYLKDALSTYMSRNSFSPEYSQVDVYRLEDTMPKLAALLKGKKAVKDWKSIDSAYRAHSTGIMGFAGFPKETEY